MKTKIKVNVDDLIEKIISKKNEEIKKHQEKLSKYEKELPKARKELANELKNLAKDLLDGNDIEIVNNYNNRSTIAFKTTFPIRVDKEFKSIHIDRDINILKISSDKAIFVSNEDYGKYF